MTRGQRPLKRLPIRASGRASAVVVRAASAAAPSADCNASSRLGHAKGLVSRPSQYSTVPSGSTSDTNASTATNPQASGRRRPSLTVPGLRAVDGETRERNTPRMNRASSHSTAPVSTSSSSASHAEYTRSYAAVYC
ncbi:hypothetical protein DEMA109039_22730 [Deinococcus marmoris]